MHEAGEAFGGIRGAGHARSTAPTPKGALQRAAAAAEDRSTRSRRTWGAGAGRSLLHRPHDVAMLARIALLLVAALQVAVLGQAGDAMPWVVAIGTLVALAGYLGRRSGGIGVALVESAVCCAGAAATAGTASALLMYLPAPAIAVGLAGRPLVLASLAGLDFGLLLVLVGNSTSWQTAVGKASQWTCLVLVVGSVCAWAATQRSRAPEPQSRYAEAYELLDRLRAVARRLPGSLDPMSSAQQLLQSCLAVAPSTAKAAVLMTVEPGQLVPLAVHGARRVPWRSPLDEPGPLRTAHLEQRPVLDVRPPDDGGRRAGSALLAVPIAVADRKVGLVVLESPALDAYEDVVEDMVSIADEAALHLDTALLFEEVRSVASMQERERLAQDMHDGVAQDLAYIGFELDSLRHQLSTISPELTDDVVMLRKHMTTMISDLRLSITGLRSGIGQERGLGAVLASYARGVGAARGLAVHLSLTESAFRLPEATEVHLFRVAQEVLSAARRDSTVSTVSITLIVDPPSALLRVEHDGIVDTQRPESGLDVKVLSDHAELSQGQLRIGPRSSGTGSCVEVVLEGSRQ